MYAAESNNNAMNSSFFFCFTVPDERSVCKVDDSFIRMMAIQYKIPYMTTMAAAKAAIAAVRSAKRDGKLPVKSLQEFHAEITDSEGGSGHGKISV